MARIIDALAAAQDAAVQMIDTSIVRVHQHGASITRNQRQSMGRSRAGLTRKIHAMVDSNGYRYGWHCALARHTMSDLPECSCLRSTAPSRRIRCNSRAGPFPYCFEPIKESLVDAGFADISATVLKSQKRITDFAMLARGLVYGSPIIDQVQQRGGVDPERVDAVVRQYRNELGNEPAIIPMQAIVFSASRPSAAV